MNLDSPLFGLNLATLLVTAILGAILFVVCSGFIKVNIILNLLKNALGTQNVPSNMLVNVLSAAIVITGSSAMYSNTISNISTLAEGLTNDQILIEELYFQKDIVFQDFNSRLKDRLVDGDEVLERDGWLMLVARNVVLDLKEGLEIGIKFYIIFVAIDLILAIVLSAAGMNMLSPTVVSVPLKLIIFYFADGWTIVYELSIGN